MFGQATDAVYHNDTKCMGLPMQCQSRPFQIIGVGYHHHHSHHAFTIHLTVATFTSRASLQPSHSFAAEMLFNTLLALTLTFLCGTSIAIPVIDQWRDTRSDFCDPGRDAGSFACSWNSYDIVSSYGLVMVLHLYADNWHLRLLAVPREWWSLLSTAAGPVVTLSMIDYTKITWILKA